MRFLQAFTHLPQRERKLKYTHFGDKKLQGAPRREVSQKTAKENWRGKSFWRTCRRALKKTTLFRQRRNTLTTPVWDRLQVPTENVGTEIESLILFSRPNAPNRPTFIAAKEFLFNFSVPNTRARVWRARHIVFSNVGSATQEYLLPSLRPMWNGNVPLSVETRLSGGAFCEVMRRS